MKKNIVVLMVLLMMFVLSGCALTDWLTPDVPVVPAVMEANVDAVLVLGGIGEADAVAWSIENVGTLDIPAYKITFDVYYPMKAKDNVMFEYTGYELDVGETHAGSVGLLPYDTPDTVSVSWELFD